MTRETLIAATAVGFVPIHLCLSCNTLRNAFYFVCVCARARARVRVIVYAAAIRLPSVSLYAESLIMLFLFFSWEGSNTAIMTIQLQPACSVESIIFCPQCNVEERRLMRALAALVIIHIV
jgi:hypothetical protein